MNAFPSNTEHCFHCRDEAQRKNPADLASLIGTKTVDTADTRALADNLPAMPRALLNVPQADYRPQPNKPTTDTNPKGSQS